MRLYLDEDSVSSLLVRLLVQAGHDVAIPADTGLAGEWDPIHLTHAIVNDRLLLTGNHDDFEDLHELVRHATGHHPGILVICRENDPRRDLTPRGIVLAIGKFVGSGIAAADQFVILNHWR